MVGSRLREVGEGAQRMRRNPWREVVNGRVRMVGDGTERGVEEENPRHEFYVRTNFSYLSPEIIG